MAGPIRPGGGVGPGHGDQGAQLVDVAGQGVHGGSTTGVADEGEHRFQLWPGGASTRHCR